MAGTRVLVNHSPEPFSNIALSLCEDVTAIGGTWLAVTHPILSLVLVSVFIGLFVRLFPKLLRLLKRKFVAAYTLIKTRFFPDTPNREVT